MTAWKTRRTIPMTYGPDKPAERLEVVSLSEAEAKLKDLVELTQRQAVQIGDLQEIVDPFGAPEGAQLRADRKLYAAAALTGLRANAVDGRFGDSGRMAATAVRDADAMLAAMGEKK